MNKELLKQYLADHAAGDERYRVHLAHWLANMFSMLVETMGSRSVWAKPPFFRGNCSDYVRFMQRLPLAPGNYFVSVIDEETFAIAWE